MWGNEGEDTEVWMGPHVVTLPDPAAGSDWTWKGPLGSAFRVLAIQTHFATDATAGNRSVTILHKDTDGNILARLPAVNTVAVSTGVDIMFGRDLGYAWITSGRQANPVLGMWMPAGGVISSDTTGMGSTDQWSKIVITYELARWRS